MSDNAQLITAYHFTREDITVSGGIATYEPDTFLDGNYYLITYGNFGGTPAVNNSYTAQPFHPQTDWSWLNQSSKKKTTQPSDPAEITGLTAVPGDDKVALLWTDPVDPDFEAIVISWSPDDESVVIAPGVQEHTVTGLTNGVEYSFVVRARTYNGQPSRGLSVTVRPEFIPVIAISAGSRHVLSLWEDGTVWSWGWNTYGQVGDGTNELRTTAVQVQGLEDVVAVSAGGDYSLALKSDGTIWAWGNNAHGGLGNGTGQNFNTPVQIPSLADIVAISADNDHALAVRADGTVWAWGANDNGELGDGSRIQRNTPVQVSNLTDAIAVSAGRSHSLALKADETVWAWGSNSCGYLGDGTTQDRRTPIQVTGLTGVIDIAANRF